jgi:hypothetical protein
VSLLDDASVFVAYVYDELDHVLGGSSTFAAELAIQSDPALAAIAQPGWNGAPTTEQGNELLADVVQSEEQSFGSQLQNAEDSGNISGLAWFKAGAIVAVAIAGVGVVGYTVRAFR